MMKERILGVGIDQTDYPSAVNSIVEWARRGESRYVCAANVHMVMEAHDSEEYRGMINAADLVTPDGMPLVWMMRVRGRPAQPRVYGPTLMRRVLVAAAREGLAVGFYGGQADVLRRLVDRLRQQQPDLLIAYAASPRRETLSDGTGEAAAAIAASGARILFVGLGCPRQEQWCAAHRGRIPAVMLGVGAAFDFLAGAQPQAPPWLQATGLEWLFRLLHEPRRLIRRYLYHNPRFVFLAVAELAGLRR